MLRTVEKGNVTTSKLYSDFAHTFREPVELVAICPTLDFLLQYSTQFFHQLLSTFPNAYATPSSPVIRVSPTVLLTETLKSTTPSALPPAS